MWANLFCRITTLAVLLPALFACGCRTKPEEDSVQRQQARAVAARKEAMKFVKKDGEVDWRKRVDAASEALETAKSESRWGRKEKALESALEAARLLPPPSKDFEMPSAASESGEADGSESGTRSGGADGENSGGADGENSGGSPGNGGGLPGETGGSAGNDSSAGEASPRVTNDEVQALRQSLEALLESLEGKAGRARSNLNVERDAIEIR